MKRFKSTKPYVSLGDGYLPDNQIKICVVAGITNSAGPEFMKSLVQNLPKGPLDVVGDVHADIGALEILPGHLGYDASGTHQDTRRLVFVGDLTDRGPDSPAVVRLVKRLVDSGIAQSRTELRLFESSESLPQVLAFNGSGDL